MSQKEKTTTPNKVRFYQKASFAWGIILVLFTLSLGFIAGWHTQQSYNQSMEQSYKNGVAETVSLKEAK